jgi:hypothetical protein
VNQGGSAMSSSELPKTILQKDFPDPHTIPVPPSPSYHQPISVVTLSELIPGKYVSTAARVVYVRTVERQDALGTKTIFSGILEDSTFKVPFVSHRISYPLIRNSIYKFNSSYVHEFPTDKSLLVVITEHTKVDSKDVEDYREYIWNPKIDLIKRPVRSVSLSGIITTVYSNSGLVKRCNKCKSILYDTCPKKCSEQGWGWDLRVSSRLYDGSGSIKMVLTKDIASRVLNRNLGELILLASQNKPLAQNQQQQQPFSVKIKTPESIEVIEAVTENASTYRSNGKLIVTDGRNLVFFPPELEEEPHKFSQHVKRLLKTSDIEDRKIIKKLIEKALDISIKKVTGMRMMQGIYLLEEPISLYRCERAKLYLGFSLRVGLIEDNNEVRVEATPQAYVRESVLDYVKLRRERGASANAVVRNLLTYRDKAIVAPSGNYGCIVDVVTTKAANQRVSETDSRNLVEFWKQVYGIDISPDEIPLLKVKMMNSENVFTYPPSMCFFGSESLLIYGNVQRFIENKKYSLKAKVEDAVRKAVQDQDLHIGSANLEVQEVSASTHSDIQSQLLQEVRQKLFGRNATARGSIMFVHDELWFFPNQIQLS